MSLDLLLGIDIGTQGVKASVFDLDGVCRSTSFISSRLFQPEPGVTEEDPEFQLDSVCRATSECVGRLSGTESDGIRCVAIDGQMAGILGVDEKGLAVTPYDSWLDTRCSVYIREMQEQAEDEIIRKTGNPPSFNHGPKILWWKSERPDVYDRIVKFVQPGVYAAMRLCGLDSRDAFIDQTYLHFSGFADNPHRTWDPGLLAAFDIDGDKLPRIVTSTDIVGEMTPEMARRCGLPDPVPVAAGCGDSAASFLSCGAVDPGICVDIAGTASVFAATTAGFCFDLTDRIVGCGASVTEGLWHPYAYVNGGGMNLEWYATAVSGRDPDDQERFVDLESEELEPHATDPLFIPHMSGRVTPSQPDMRGTFAGLSRNHTSRDLFRAVMEGVALEYGIYRDALRRMLPGAEMTELRVTGGGEKSRLWNTMKSAVLRIPVVSIGQGHGAPMGSAMVAGMASGLLASARQASEQWVTPGETVSCDAGLWPFYERRVGEYRALLETMSAYYSSGR